MTQEGNEEVKNEGTEETAGAEALKAAQAEAAQLKAQVERLMKVMADPDVTEIIKAKEAKQSVRLVVSGGEPAEPAEPAMPDAVTMEGMGNAELVKLILDQMDARIAKVVEASPVAQSVAELTAERSRERVEELKRQAATLKEKYEDFPEYVKDVKELMKDGKTSMEEAYVLARLRAGKGLPTAPTAVERPSSLVVREKIKEAPARRGRRGFEQDLEDALRSLDIDEIVASR